MIGIVDYGLGNVEAFANIYRRLGIQAHAASTADDILRSDRLILPGVGAFDWAMERLHASGLREPLEDAVLRQKKPLLGICVGMQMLADRSDEGITPGLGWIKGEVLRLPPCSKERPLPHMGWNDVAVIASDELFSSLNHPRFYFLHSYYFSPSQPSSRLANTDYGIKFTSAVRNQHIYGTQFHPEKSHEWGVQLLRNFSHITSHA